jgi:hypothetical protein
MRLAGDGGGAGEWVGWGGGQAGRAGRWNGSDPLRTLNCGERAVLCAPAAAAATAAAALAAAGVRGLLRRQRPSASARALPGVGPGPASPPSAARCRVRAATGCPACRAAAVMRGPGSDSEGLERRGGLSESRANVRVYRRCSMVECGRRGTAQPGTHE